MGHANIEVTERSAAKVDVLVCLDAATSIPQSQIWQVVAFAAQTDVSFAMGFAHPAAVVDEGMIKGDAKPILIYADRPKVAGSSGGT